MDTAFETKKRKPPAERRLEIVAAAARIAVAEGLESLTLRRVADELGVVAGLVNHYFPVAEELAAAAFGHAAAAERDGIFAAIGAARAPLAQLREMLAILLADSSDDISLLWLDAWQATRKRPALRAEVARQMDGWMQNVAALISRGAKSGIFKVSDPKRAARRIMALIDGFSIQAAMCSAVAYGAVRDMVFETIERELGLPPGTLRGA